MSENRFHPVTPDQSHVPSHPTSGVRWGTIEVVKPTPEPSDDEFHNTAANAGTLGSASIKRTAVDLGVGSAVEDA